MYVCFHGYLALDRQFVCSFLGKTTSLDLSFAQLPLVLCVRLRPCGLSPVIFMGVVLVWLMLARLYGMFLMLLGSQVPDSLALIGFLLFFHHVS